MGEDEVKRGEQSSEGSRARWLGVHAREVRIGAK
jgi:hypothetical protein